MSARFCVVRHDGHVVHSAMTAAQAEEAVRWLTSRACGPYFVRDEANVWSSLVDVYATSDRAIALLDAMDVLDAIDRVPADLMVEAMATAEAAQ